MSYISEIKDRFLAILRHTGPFEVEAALEGGVLICQINAERLMVRSIKDEASSDSLYIFDTGKLIMNNIELQDPMCFYKFFKIVEVVFGAVEHHESFVRELPSWG